MSRPLGVTIISILVLINGILLILGGAMLYYYGPIIMSLMMSKMTTIKLPPNMSVAMLKYALTFGMIFAIVFGIVGIIIAVGLWMGKNWAWWVFVILSALALISAVVNGLLYGKITDQLLIIVIEAIILVYMTRPHVREYFRE